MGKSPADQFYWQDWARDLEEHPLKIEGAWIRICCKLWWAETRGEMTKSPIQWARILRVSKRMAVGILKYIKNEKIGDVTFCNPNVTVRCRRMWRDEKRRQANRDKVAKHRKKQKPESNSECNQDVTPLSSSSSSTSPSLLNDTIVSSSQKTVTCPQKNIIELYHKILPELSHINSWPDHLQKILRTRWREDKDRQNIEWWKNYFKFIKESPFLMGKKTDFQVDLEWVIGPKNMTKILNGRYHKDHPLSGKVSSKTIKTIENLKEWLNGK